jgi:Protein of unknown function (DUF4232)
LRKPFRRIAAAAAVVLALGTGSAIWASTSASAAPTTPAVSEGLLPVCTAGDLAVWVNYGAMQGAAGTWYYPLEFTNTSSHTCRTWGWPGVSATDANGRQLGDAARRLTLYTPHWVNIGAGATAHALFAYGAAEVSTSGCKPTNASLIKVYPPNQRTADYGFFSLPVCTVGGGHVYLRVAAIQPGTNI